MGKSGFWLLQQKLWADGKLLGNVTMAVWAGFIIVHKRPSWLVESGAPWGGMQPPRAPHVTQYVFRMDFAPSKAPSGQNRISLKQREEQASQCPHGVFSCVFQMPRSINEGPQLLSKWLSFKLRVGSYTGTTGEVPRWKSKQKLLYSTKEKNRFPSSATYDPIS